MSTHESTTGTAPTHGSTAGAGAAESIKETVHHIQDIGDTIRENAMDFVDTMFGTPRHPGESSDRAAKTGEDVTRAERPGAGDVPRADHAGDETTARSSASTASHADDATVRSSEPATDPSAGAGTAGKGGGATEAAPTQPTEKATAPPPLPPRGV